MDQQVQSQEYEFDAGQNTIISSLAGGMQFCGVFELILGIIYAILAALALVGGGLVPAIIYGITATVWIVLAGMQMRASGYFRSVVDTQGSDITLLMTALDHMRGYFNLKRILYIVAMCLLVLGIAVGILFMARKRAADDERFDRYGDTAPSELR